MYEETTIAAIATAPGEGGIGIIRISGPEAARIAGRVFRKRNGESFEAGETQRLYYGHIMDGERSIDEGLAVLMRAPHSYTGEDTAELQIHGSRAALRETLSLVLAAGARLAERGEFTERAFMNGRLDLAQAEAVMDIITARGRAALSAAESHLAGALSGYVRETRDALTALISKLEVTIDYPEEDIEDLTREEIARGIAEISGPMEALLLRSKEGRILREGMKTAIIGRPNAGKSSLLNALLEEERAIVTDIPGTTRDTIEETVEIGGVPLVLMDTAGLRRTEDEVERIGIRRAKASMEAADLILAVIDASRPLTEEDKEILADLRGRRAVVLMNKSDLPAAACAEDIRAIAGSVPVISLSAKNGDGMDALRGELRKLTEHQDAEAGRTLYLTNLRHIEAVRRALEAASRAAASAAEGLPADCITVDLTEAWQALGEITGEAVDDELIHAIFSNFCVGK